MISPIINFFCSYGKCYKFAEKVMFHFLWILKKDIMLILMNFWPNLGKQILMIEDEFKLFFETLYACRWSPVGKINQRNEAMLYNT